MEQFFSNKCTIFLLVILIASCLSQLARWNEGTCSKPADIANANLRSKYRNIEEFTDGSEVEYDCNIGYSITGRRRNRKCLKSGNWSPVEFVCEPILCPELSSLTNGDIFQDTRDGVRNNYGSIVQYTCNYGFTINGTNSRQINRRCEADGTWDGYNYFCDIEKCEHIELPGGYLNYFGSTHRGAGTYAYYSCNEGYTMFPSGVDYSECMRTILRWQPDPPKCYRKCRLQDYLPIDKSLVRRQKDGERNNVELTDRDDIIHGETIIYSCKYPRSYELCVRSNNKDSCQDQDLEKFDTTCADGILDKVKGDTLITCVELREDGKEETVRSASDKSSYGCLTPKDAPIINVPKESYVIGEIIDSDQFVCPTNHVLMPRNGMICLDGGWTETAKCIPNDQIDTIDDPFTAVICGLRPMELESRKKHGISESELASESQEFDRIVGGSTAAKGFYPWQVGVRVPDVKYGGDKHYCGATIISEYWILSAAHCFKKWLKANVTVRIGDHDNIHQDEFEQEFELEYLIKHSRYNETPHDYDIALLKIKPNNGTGIKFGKHVQPACLPDQSSSYVDGQKCHVSGWGRTTNNGYPDILHSAIVPIINDETCRRLYNIITPRMVCAGYLEGGIDTCFGDSGGPLVCDINSRYTLMGATSWGYGCGEENAPGVYARIKEFVPWIKANVKEYSGECRYR